MIVKKIENQSGQALVVVLLSLSVVLTLVLFVLSRSITDVTVSSSDEQSVRAFSAAEAGIERALVIGQSYNDPNLNFSSTVTSFAEGAKDFNYPIALSSGESATTWFTAHDANGNTICDLSNACFTGDTVKLCWGAPGTDANVATTPAVEISIFYDSKIARGVYDPNVSRRGSNNFSAPDNGTCTVGGVSYAFYKTITLSSLGIPSGSYNLAGGLQFARTRMFYNTTTTHPVGLSVNFANDSVLPSQGMDISSTGTAGESNRRLNVFQGFPEAPSIFDYAVYSGVGLTK